MIGTLYAAGNLDFKTVTHGRHIQLVEKCVNWLSHLLANH